jgi:hypothetical protein
MIRRDYILRMIEEFIQVLLQIRTRKSEQRWDEAAGMVDEGLQRLVGAGAPALAQLSETELLAKLIEGEPTQAVRDKVLLLTTLLKEAGDLAAAQSRPEESHGCYVKGLHLLLNTLAREETDLLPDFVPKVEVFIDALQGWPLSLRTQALLMEHYERTGQFARAEDALFAILESEPDSAEAIDFGIAFYERLSGQSDAALSEGNLPRAELVAAMAELRDRKAALVSRTNQLRAIESDRLRRREGQVGGAAD